MSDMPTSTQYRLGVRIGHAMVEAMEEGANYDEVIATLHHSVRVMERNRDFGVDQRSRGTVQ